MQPGLEKRIVSKIMRKLKARKDCYCFKVHGGLYTAGQPDIIGCLAGRAFGLEVKVPGCKPTVLQEHTLECWRQAGAIAAVVHSWEEAREVLGLDED